MRPHEKFFQQEIRRIQRVKEKAIRSGYETKKERVVISLLEEIKSGKAVLLPETLEYREYSLTPPIGDCFSFSDGSRLEAITGKLAKDMHEALDRLGDQADDITRSVVLGDLDKPTLLRMLVEFEAFGETSDVIESLQAGSLPRLVAIGDSVVNAIKAVRQHTGWDLKASKEFVDSAPIDFPVLDRQTTLALIRDLRESGAVVKITRQETTRSCNG